MSTVPMCRRRWTSAAHPYYMEDYLRRKGYITDFTGRHWKIRLPQYEHFTRLDTLDERWTPETDPKANRSDMLLSAIVGRISATHPKCRRSFTGLVPARSIRPVISTKQYLALLLSAGRTYRSTPTISPTSLYLKEDLRKLDEPSEQVRYMGKYGIETFDDLYAEREKLQRDMDALITRRTKLQNKISPCYPRRKGNAAAGKGRCDRANYHTAKATEAE